eukprot:1139430-Pelagomonas_calceolata.AAC.5
MSANLMEWRDTVAFSRAWFQLSTWIGLTNPKHSKANAMQLQSTCCTVDWFGMLPSEAPSSSLQATAHLHPAFTLACQLYCKSFTLHTLCLPLSLAASS